jgi:AraC family transcriptional regulator, regulatory protein of adaptative response / DNA-3-methyladenine glycosylase II
MRDVIAHDPTPLSLNYYPPYAWQELLAFFEQRAIPGVEQVDNNRYTRCLRLMNPKSNSAVQGWIQVENDEGAQQLRVQVSAELAEHSERVLAHVRRVFDIDADAEAIRKHLGKLAHRQPALRLPGAFDGFELAMRAVLGQQITVKAARTLATRFVQKFAQRCEWKNKNIEVHYVFPSAQQIAHCNVSDIAALGIVSARAKAMIAIAEKISAGELNLSPSANPEITIAALCNIAGIGPWTAHYIAMRALSWPDAWPPRDVAILNAMGLPNTAAAQKQLDALAEQWRPWRSYAVLHAWYSLSKQDKS